MSVFAIRTGRWHLALLLRVILAIETLLSLAMAAQPAPPFRLRELPKDQVYELGVLYVEDERLPTITEAQRRALYEKWVQLTRAWYGYEVRFREVARKNLAPYFASQEAVFQRHADELRRQMLDLDFMDDRRRLRDTVTLDFNGRELPLIERYLRAGKLESKPAAVDVALRQFTAQLREIQATPVSGGGPLVEKANARQHAYPAWDFLLHEIEEADIVLTNTAIVGADITMPIYVIARGGVTTAITNNNPRSPLQAAMAVTLFPFLSNAPVFLRERGAIPEAELLDVIATLGMHELGHLLLRYAEYYDHPHCVHVAPQGLNYYTWHQAVRAGGPCPLPHRKLERF